jgi:hypothetical protein
MRPAAPLLLSLLCGCGADPAAKGPVDAESATGALRVEVTTSPDPLQRGVNQAELLLTGRDGTPLRGQPLSVVPWMPSHGHGSSVMPSVTERADGHYEVSNLYLAMPGAWQLRISTGSDEVAPTFDVR